MGSSNKQLGINMVASVASTLVSYLISILLTPYIVKELGVAAYGFVGLSNQIIGYSSLVTIALNAMAGRFVAIEYHKGDYAKANSYLSSVFCGNLIISAALLLVACVLVIYLDFVINIPDELIGDVKLLFAFLAVNSVMALVTNVYGMSTFIKNRLDYSNVRGIVGNLLRAAVLVSLFVCFSPKVWFFGVTTLITTVYVTATNISFTRRLTPELCLDYRLFDIACVKDLLSAGVWNLITKLATMLESGFNLLLANLFIGARMAGMLAVSTTIPLIINSICGVMAGNFSPSWTQLFAKGNKEEMRHEILKSIRIMGFLSSVPICVFAVHGEAFFRLWLPTEDSVLLYWLALVGMLEMVVAMPLESLWNVFTITNNVKRSSINLLEFGVAMFVTVLIGMYTTESLLVRLFIVASVKSVLGTVRTLTFLPFYGAKCLGYDRWTFYPYILRNLLCSILVFCVCFAISVFIAQDSWLQLAVAVSISGLVGVVANYYLSLNQNDRIYICQLVRRRA